MSNIYIINNQLFNYISKTSCLYMRLAGDFKILIFLVLNKITIDYLVYILINQQFKYS